MVAPPRGRPPKHHFWRDGKYIHQDTFQEFGREKHDDAARENWRKIKKERYNADHNGAREKQLRRVEKRRRALGAKARRKKLSNYTLFAYISKELN
jgi:hypothetical protein